MKINIKITNKKAKVFGKFLLPFCFACLFLIFSVNLFAQTPTDFLILADRIRNGTDEIKRDILLEIRNIRTEQASRLAIPALKDDSEIVRATATNSVIFLPQDEAAQLLIPLLQEKSILVRRETAYALGKTRNPQAVNSLLQILQKDKQIEVRDAAAIALGEIGVVFAVDYLTKILQRKPQTSESFLRRSAARSLGKIAHFQQFQEYPKTFFGKIYESDSQTLFNPKYKNLLETFPVFQKTNEVLTAILQNKKESVDTKREAAFALGEIGDRSSIKILEQNLNAEDYYLAETSREALLKIGKYIENETKSRN